TQPWSVLASAPHDAVKAHRRREVVAELTPIETEHCEKQRDAFRVAREIAVSRIHASDVRAKWALRASLIVIKRELIAPIQLRTGCGRRVIRRRHQWVACHRSADECRSQMLCRMRISL